MGRLHLNSTMKLIVLAVLALAVCALATDYTKIDQKTCTDSSCSSCDDDGDFPANQCLRSSAPGYFLLVNCSTDGTMLNEYVFTDSTCSGSARSASIRTDTCTPVTNGGYAEWTCVSGELAATPTAPPPRTCSPTFNRIALHATVFSHSLMHPVNRF